MEFIETILELLGAIPGMEYILPGLLVLIGANHVIKNYFSGDDDASSLAERVRGGFDNIRRRIKRARDDNRESKEDARDAGRTVDEGRERNRDARETAGDARESARNAGESVDDAKQSNRDAREQSDRARKIIDRVRERNENDE